MKQATILFFLIAFVLPNVTSAATTYQAADEAYNLSTQTSQDSYRTLAQAATTDTTDTTNTSEVLTNDEDSEASNSDGKLVNPLKVGTLRELGTVLFEVIKTLLEIVLVAAIVWCGWLFIKAQGNPKEITKAREALLWTLLGGVMVLGINVIYDIIVATLEQL